MDFNMTKNINLYHGTSKHAWNNTGNILYITSSLQDATNYASEAAMIDEEEGRPVEPIIILIPTEMPEHIILEPDWGWVDGLEHDANGAAFKTPSWEDSLEKCHGICLNGFTESDKENLNILPLNDGTICLYHVTTKDSLADILENGLIPKIGPRSSACGETEPAVFCFKSKEDIEDANWIVDAFEDEDGNDIEIVILEINFTGQKFKSDVGYEIAILEAIEPSDIVMTYSEDWSINDEFGISVKL